MAGRISILWTLSLGLSLQLFSVCAKAQPAEAQTVSQESDSAVAAATPAIGATPPAVELMSFRVRAASPVVRMEIHTLHDDVVARCLDRCQLQLPKGDYHAMLYDAGGRALGAAAFSVIGEGGVEIEPPNPGAATTGQVLGIAGTTMLPIALLLIVSASCINECESTPGQRLRGGIGLGMLAAGATLTPVGWVMYGRNNKAHTTAYTRAAFRPTLAPTRDGAVFGIVGRF